MSNYIFIENGKINGCGQCRCLNEDILNIEVDDQTFQEFLNDSLTFIWDGQKLIPNPNYNIDVQKRINAERNEQINDKIRELQEIAFADILNNNMTNIEVYKQIVNGLLKDKK